MIIDLPDREATVNLGSERLTFLPENYLEITLLDRGEQGRRALLNFVGGDEKNRDPTGIAIST